MPRPCPRALSPDERCSAYSGMPLVCLWPRSPLQSCQGHSKNHGTVERHVEDCTQFAFVVWRWEEGGGGDKCRMIRANSDGFNSTMVSQVRFFRTVIASHFIVKHWVMTMSTLTVDNIDRKYFCKLPFSHPISDDGN